MAFGLINLISKLKVYFYGGIMLRTFIQLQNISLFFLDKNCFLSFTKNIYFGNRIGIFGTNGTGKTSLLKIIQKLLLPTEGNVIVAENIRFGYVPQIILEHNKLSGAERFNKALTTALVEQPSVLCLDEPTNHLDLSQRKSLLKMLQNYSGTLIIVTHDLEVLKSCVNERWHIDQNKITCFAGSYDDYILAYNSNKNRLEQKLKALKHEKKQIHLSLMKEQQRKKNKKTYGQKKYADDKLIANQKQNSAENCAGKNSLNIIKNKAAILEQLQQYRQPEVIVPKFNLPNAYCSSNKTLVYIEQGACGYQINNKNHYIVQHIQLHIVGGQHVVIQGDNASGKSTIIRAILQEGSIIKAGNWQTIDKTEIGYLDQHYSNLDLNSTVLDCILQVCPDWNTVQARKHLNTFLFRDNQEVFSKVQVLSGGERVRLSLAQITAANPKLIILDEVTNNLDLETKEHMIEVLTAYPGAVLIVSHDKDFLSRIKVDQTYTVDNGELYG